MENDKILKRMLEGKPDEKAEKEQLKEYKTELEKEFKKLGKNDIVNRCITDVYKIELQFKPEEDINKSDYNIYVFGDKNVYMSDKIKKCIDEFIDEKSYSFHYYAKQLNWAVPSAIEDYLNKDAKDVYHYWCGLDFLGMHIFTEYDCYNLWLIEFDKNKINRELEFNGELHPYFKAIGIQWSRNYARKNGLHLYFNELYRIASTTMGAGNFLYMYENDINVLSSMLYENAENVGSIIYIINPDKKSEDKDKNIFDIQIKLMLSISFNSANYKKIRKLLEVAKNGLSLLLNDNGEIFAIGKIKHRTKCEYFEVRFAGNSFWKLYKNEKLFMEFKNMIPTFPTKTGISTRHLELLSRTFGKADMIKLEEIMECASKQRHGTMVVITENAAKESQRLNGSGIVIAQKKLERDLVDVVSGIDGAIMCDEQGTCYAIGVILDGKVSTKDDSSRGARYNSAIRYIEKCKDEKEKTFIMIVSEDGYINCISTEE